MRIDLEYDELGNLIKECIDTMQNNFGVSRVTKRRAWWKRVLVCLRDYENSIKTRFIPVLIQDFGGSVSVKISGDKMDESEVDKLQEFKRMVERSDIDDYKDELKRQVTENRIDDVEEWMNIIDKCHDECKMSIDLYIRSQILKNIEDQTRERSNLETKVYNFTDKMIPDEVVKLFTNGIDAVPEIGMSIMDVKQRVNDSILRYLEGYRFKRNGGCRFIKDMDVISWLDKAIEDEHEQEDLEFYERVKAGYTGLLSEVELTSYNKKNIDTEDELRKKMEIKGCAIVLCDKGLGMSMFTLEVMRKADETLMDQLEARFVGTNKEEILIKVKDKIVEFESELNQEQRQYMDVVYKERDLTKCKVVLPFLKSAHKIHKMTSEEIKCKDLSKLKFRPVIDSKQWITRGYADLAMKMIRKVVSEILEEVGPVMSESKVKNGWQFSVDMVEQKLDEKFAVLMSADIQEAYTNVTSKMINQAIKFVCTILKYPEWKVDLMMKINTLVLSNNFVETSGGIYHFKEVLPMGYKVSGEALDIVAISGEIMKMYHLGDLSKNDIGLPVSELTNYPAEMVTGSVKQELNMARGIVQYKRYVDDTHAIIKGNVEEIIDGILAIGFTFPCGLVINLDLNIWRSQFLDVWSWRDLSETGMNTMMKRNFSVPFGHVKKLSDHPEQFKLKSMMGEMLRGRRIASDEEIIKVTDDCIKEDFVSIGYSRRRVNAEMEDCLSRIEEKYSKQYVKYDETGLGQRFQYWAGIVYNGNYEYNRLVDKFVRAVKPVGAPQIMKLPGKKIKNIVYTKKRYLKRQRDEMNK